MYGRGGLEKFRKAQSLVGLDKFCPKNHACSSSTTFDSQNVAAQPQQEDQTQVQPATQLGGGQSTWQPPDWAIEPRTGVYYLEVLKEGQVLDRVKLDRRRHIFGRHHHTCDFVLDHQSVSRQHAAVVPHKNGLFATLRLTKDTPVELEVGKSLRFAASTRTYIIRKNNAALFTHPPPPAEINLPPMPNPADEEAVVAYNTLINRYGLSKPDPLPKFSSSSISLAGKEDSTESERRAKKRMRKLEVTFKDQVGGELVEVVGISDGADVETEPGPLGVKEGSLVGKYESLVQTTVIPKGKDQSSIKEENVIQKGVTDKLQEVLNKVKNALKGGIYDDLYGKSLSDKVGSSWAYTSDSSTCRQGSSCPTKDAVTGKRIDISSGRPGSNTASNDDDSEDDLFGNY